MDIINKKTYSNIKEKDIENYNEELKLPKLFSEEELNILRTNSTTYLCKNYLNLYNKYRKYNPDGKKFTHTKWTEEIVDKELSKMITWKGFYKNNPALYQVTMKRFKHLKEKHFNK